MYMYQYQYLYIQVGYGTTSVDYIWWRPLVCFHVKDASKVKQIVSVLGQEPKWIATVTVIEQSKAQGCNESTPLVNHEFNK